MIRSRNQNSFLAVATLGVYLGLILAGATPTVLAQAATSKQFSVKDEVKSGDELDDNPVRQTPAEGLESYLAQAEAFLDTLRNPASPFRTEDGFQNVDFLLGSRLTCSSGARDLWLDSRGNDIAPKSALPILTQFARHLQNSNGLGDCESYGLAGHPAVSTSVRVQLGNDGLAIQLNFYKLTAGDASILVDQLRASKDEHDSATATRFRAQLFASTKITGQANSTAVTINTLLPRGSLDTLLASKAK